MRANAIAIANGRKCNFALTEHRHRAKQFQRNFQSSLENAILFICILRTLAYPLNGNGSEQRTAAADAIEHLAILV